MHSFSTPAGTAPHQPPCAVEPERMFPAVESVAAGTANEAERSALAVCARCPLLGPCREWALDARLPYGVAGAMTVADRRATRRVARRQMSEPAA